MRSGHFYSRQIILWGLSLGALIVIARWLGPQLHTDWGLYANALPATLATTVGSAIGALFVAASMALMAHRFARVAFIVEIVGSLTNFVPLLLVAPVATSVYGDIAPELLGVFAGVFPAYSIIRARLSERFPAVELALRSVGATPFQLFRLITVPRLSAAGLAAFGMTLPAAMLGVLIGEMALGERMGNLLVAFSWQGNLDRIVSASLILTILIAAPTLLVREFARALDRSNIQPIVPPHRASRVISWTMLPKIAAAAGVILVIWTVISVIVNVDWFVPTPVTFARRLIADGSTSAVAISSSIGRTATVALVGAILSFGIAATIVYTIRIAKHGSQPLQVATLITEVTPLVVFIPLIALAVGRGIAAEVVVAVLASFFPLYATLQFGTASVSRGMLSVVGSLSNSIWKEYRFVRMPAAMPYFGAAIETVVPKVILGALLGQYLITREGLGAVVYEARGRLDFTTIWLAIVVLSFLSSLIVAGVRSAIGTTARRK